MQKHEPNYSRGTEFSEWDTAVSLCIAGMLTGFIGALLMVAQKTYLEGGALLALFGMSIAMMDRSLDNKEKSPATTQ